MRGAEIARHSGRIEAALAEGAAARSALVASWSRSARLHGLDAARPLKPARLTEAEFRAARDRMGPLVAAAAPILDGLFRAVGGVGCCVLLADRDGVPLERRGSRGDDPTFADWGLWTGALWSEAAQGTNGIGTCLAEGRAVTIHRDQHFLARNTALSCMTAPIFDHEGSLAGALDVSSARAELTEALAALIAHSVAECRPPDRGRGLPPRLPEGAFSAGAGGRGRCRGAAGGRWRRSGDRRQPRGAPGSADHRRSGGGAAPGRRPAGNPRRRRGRRRAAARIATRDAGRWRAGGAACGRWRGRAATSRPRHARSGSRAPRCTANLRRGAARGAMAPAARRRPPCLPPVISVVQIPMTRPAGLRRRPDGGGPPIRPATCRSLATGRPRRPLLPGLTGGARAVQALPGCREEAASAFRRTA